MKNKKGNAGMITRLIASFVIVFSLPFIVINPLNPFALIGFAFGNFLLVLGGILP